MRKNGFTLLELLVVIGILVLLIGLLIGFYGHQGGKSADDLVVVGGN